MSEHSQAGVAVQGSRHRDAGASRVRAIRRMAPVPTRTKSPVPDRVVEVEVETEPTVVLPRPEAPVPEGHRRCPTLSGDVQPLVRQTIDEPTCAGRQCDGYHKCVGCVYHVEPQFAGRELPPLENSPSLAALERLAK